MLKHSDSRFVYDDMLCYESLPFMWSIFILDISPHQYYYSDNQDNNPKVGVDVYNMEINIHVCACAHWQVS